MKITELIEMIKQDKNCNVRPANHDIAMPANIPEDLKEFFELTDGIRLFEERSFGINIVGRKDFIPTNKRLYPPDDVMWEEIEDHVSNEWYLIAETEQLSQYISVDLTKERFGQCYDSFYETHSLEGDSAIVAKNFTDLLYNLYSNKGKHWYWLQPEFIKLGDAYDEPTL
ncbi:SMI1/KNR4 family protein [Flavobacterium crocinum]|uniref:SMI1/KNR4 family protein n=1 Tax=Flavobacterium crocinum TaxID=2183896 RepID=A0A2S1YHT6_9FLAO|nr:SMI1/KNR4 family protein [Flavobacterium crocinum]AWK03528.1 SMI1/KNR4 family protein [Flavobacterium crocinum]